MRRSLLIAWVFCLLTMPLLLFSQSRQISGRVLDETGAPLAFASILVKGTSTGISADNEGRFTITVPGPTAILVVSSTGFQTQEIRVGNNSTITASLQAEAGLSEVVVTAMGIRREKRALGYSTQEVSGEELLAAKQPNVVNALQGKVAGVQINSTGGSPGQGARIVIRGIKSLDPTNDNQPLFVIDGVIMDNSTVTGSTQAELRGMTNRAADINPDDVESISVLKGGAATALYGQAGSNGVVVITTKSAKSGRMAVNLTTTYGVEEVNKFPDVQMRYTQGNNGVYSPTEFFPSFGPTTEEAKLIDPTHPDQIFHHYKRAYQQGNQFRTSLNLSGGNERALLSSSISYLKQNGVIPNSDFKSISARLNGQIKLSDKLTFSPSIFFVNSGGYRVNADRFNESLTYWSPRWDVQDYINENGTMKTYANHNPIYATATNRFKDDVYRVIGNVLLNYAPTDWFHIDYRFGVDHYSDFRRHTAPGPRGLVGEIQHADNGLGFVREYRISNRILNSNIMATLSHDFSDKFNVSLRGGNEIRDISNNSLEATGAELDVPTLLTLNNTRIRNNTHAQSLYRIYSFYGDLSLSWDNYLFLNVTGRNDWSSTFAPGNNSFFYPSASLSYVFSDHLNVPSWLSFGKFRASVAGIGKDTRPYRLSTYYASTALQSNGQVVWTRSDQKGDFGLIPEKTTTVEVGTELRFLNNRFGVDFTWYKLNSRNQIIPVSVSPTTGFTSMILNSGEIENRGVEIALNLNPVRTANFRWDVNFNYSSNRNEVVSIREGLTEIVVATHFGYVGSAATMKYVPGYAVGNIYGTSYQRYYDGKPDDGMTLQRDLPQVIGTTGTNAGFPLRDLTQRILGNSQPRWIGGLTNSFTYKNFSLSFLFDTHQGHYRYNQLGNFLSAFGIAKYTENREETVVFPGVLPDGTANTQQVWLGQGVGPDGRNYTAGFYRNVHRGVTENFVEDASWVRLRNLNISYSLPSTVFRSSFVKGATFTLTGNNLLLFTDYTGFDPETSSFNSGSNVDAFTGFTYPAVRSVMASINLNF